MQKSWDYIQVEQTASFILWKEKKYKNWWSYTPVFDNPRTFVIKKTSNKNYQLILPVYLVKDEVEKRC